MNRLSNHIDGTPRPPGTGRWLPNLDPATGTLLGDVPDSDAEDVDRAVTSALRAAPGWANTDPSERARLCDAIADRMEDEQDELARLESLDTGKPFRLARTLDIPRAIANFRFFADAVRQDATACHVSSRAINYTLRRPLGVVGLITPWNLPLYLLSWKVAPAIATGNCVVAKPSELTPTTASRLATLATETGLPDGVLNLVHGRGPTVGERLVAHPDVRGISFTGGTHTGRRVAATAAPHFKKLSLELGGKNATLVFEDADVELAIAGAGRSAFLNQGEICLCGSRVLVHASIYPRVVEGLVRYAEALKVGDPRHSSTDIGALITDTHRQKVEAALDQARREGGTVLCGGTRPSRLTGAFLEPAVVTGLESSSPVAMEEIFGPVVTIHPFHTEAQALEMANRVRYGLSASIWTRDLGRAHRVARCLETGMVWVNTWLLRDLRVPFGGVKDSGLGTEGGRHSLAFYTDPRNICIYTGEAH